MSMVRSGSRSYTGMVLSVVLASVWDGSSAVLSSFCFTGGPDQDRPLLPGRADFWRRIHELYARRTGRTEVYGRDPAERLAVQRPKYDGDGANAHLDYAALLCGHGVGHLHRGQKDHQICGHGHGEAGEVSGFSADIAASICLLISSVFGLPVSTTHAKTTAIMGVGAVRRISAINFSVVKDIGFDLGVDLSGVRSHRFFNGEALYFNFLTCKIGRDRDKLWQIKQTGFIMRTLSKRRTAPARLQIIWWNACRLLTPKNGDHIGHDS